MTPPPSRVDRSAIDGEFFDGTDDEIFLCTVKENITHGLFAGFRRT
ncbi:hypothetical protein [Streptomyces sp. 900105755]